MHLIGISACSMTDLKFTTVLLFVVLMVEPAGQTAIAEPLGTVVTLNCSTNRQVTELYWSVLFQDADAALSSPISLQPFGIRVVEDRGKWSEFKISGSVVNSASGDYTCVSTIGTAQCVNQITVLLYGI